jgi:hypothetical protein
MPRYLVTWSIDIFEAADERLAAADALRIMRDSDSTALVFSVREYRSGVEVTVDLDAPAPSAVDELDSSTRWRRGR